LGEKRAVAALLAQQPIRDDNVEQFVEVLLHEGIDTERGYQLVLDHYGTCNAITTMQSALYGRPKLERQAAGKLLVRHVHDELLSNVKAHIARQEDAQPAGERLVELIAARPWLFEGGTYHIDTSHLSSTVQIAGELTDEPSLVLALDLTAYGRQLDRQLQYPGEEPFVDLYPSTSLFFAAQLGQDVEQALTFFLAKARGVRPREDGTGCIEVYIDLLARVGKTSEAIDATLEMIPRGIQTTGRAPALLELCQQANQFDRMQAVCQERGDLLGYVVALMRAEGACSSARR
jgi:hypothetical protein